jgi:hypothetical protein
MQVLLGYVHLHCLSLHLAFPECVVAGAPVIQRVFHLPGVFIQVCEEFLLSFRFSSSFLFDPSIPSSFCFSSSNSSESLTTLALSSLHVLEGEIGVPAAPVNVNMNDLHEEEKVPSSEAATPVTVPESPQDVSDDNGGKMCNTLFGIRWLTSVHFRKLTDSAPSTRGGAS